jgi:uncharacterized membrane protein
VGDDCLFEPSAILHFRLTPERHHPHCARISKMRTPLLDTIHSQVQTLLFALSQWWPCHQMRTRSFTVRGRQVPLCARCFGMIVGTTVAPMWVVAAVPSWVAGAILLAFLTDGLTQLAGLRESRNWLRFTTGIGFSGSCLKLGWVLAHGA